MQLVSFVSFLTDGEWLTSPELYSLIKPDFWHFVAQDSEIVVCHLDLFLRHAKGTVVQERNKAENSLSIYHGTVTQPRKACVNTV